MSEAWEIMDSLLGDERTVIAAEPPELDDTWRRLTSGQTHSPQVWTDAYLAAFALAGNLEVVTFDHGFLQYPTLKLTLLS